ncbi:UNVERIFIED_CONTAM: hypothetical protein HDU68_000618 [Siphonaria sp. JEL0065]|nr:hypothetical protein HDU68_000618 [Siphonaria sp. JEL0065]
MYSDKSCTTAQSVVQYSGTGICQNGMSGVMSTFEDAAKLDTNINFPLIPVSVAVILVTVGGIFAYRIRRRQPVNETIKPNINKDVPESLHQVNVEKDDDEIQNCDLDDSVETIQVLVGTDIAVEEEIREQKQKYNPLFGPLNIIQQQGERRNVIVDKSMEDSSTSPHQESNQNPNKWTTEQVAEFVSKNGGTQEPVYAEKINGAVLMGHSLDRLFIALKITTLGDQYRFEKAMGLLSRLPTYEEVSK